VTRRYFEGIRYHQLTTKFLRTNANALNQKKIKIDPQWTCTVGK
jgi:hypothetical protein